MPIRVCRTVIRSNDKFDVWDENGRCEASFLNVCRLTRWSASDSSFSGQNGVISVGVVFFFSGRAHNSKRSYAYSGGVYQSVPPINASSGTLSLHTSAHTLTLNSHR
jgi:hypothetical protein